jgi:hypothetical protein
MINLTEENWKIGLKQMVLWNRVQKITFGSRRDDIEEE